MSESEVSEMAGVHGSGPRDRWVELRQIDTHVSIQIEGQSSSLTVAEARKLANQLRRLAHRIERKAQ